MQRISAWLGGLVFVLICLAVAAVFVFRAAVVPYLEQHVFVTHPNFTQTPKAFDTPYQSLTIDSDGRMLSAWVVDAGGDTPAVLLFSGNGQTIHGWSNVQAYLFRQHVSSMVFDYSGFGDSTGKPTVEHLNQDAGAAWQAFTTWAGAQRPKFVVAYSLGSAVALHNVAQFEPQPLGIAVYGAFSSAKDFMVYLRALPAWLAPIAPDPWDSVSAARHLKAPLLVVAGMNDADVPPIMGRQIALFALAGAGGQFVMVPNAGHFGIFDSHMDAVWKPILDFMKQRSSDAAAGHAKGVASAQ